MLNFDLGNEVEFASLNSNLLWDQICTYMPSALLVGKQLLRYSYMTREVRVF